MCSQWSSLDYGIVKYSSFLPKPSSGFLMSAKPDSFSKELSSLLHSPDHLADLFFRFFRPYPSILYDETGPVANRGILVGKK